MGLELFTRLFDFSVLHTFPGCSKRRHYRIAPIKKNSDCSNLPCIIHQRRIEVIRRCVSSNIIHDAGKQRCQITFQCFREKFTLSLLLLLICELTF